MEQHFKEKFNKLFEHLATEQQVTDDDIRSLMFGDYMASKDEQRSYDEVQDLDNLREVIGYHLFCIIIMLYLSKTTNSGNFFYRESTIGRQ